MDDPEGNKPESTSEVKHLFSSVQPIYLIAYLARLVSFFFYVASMLQLNIYILEIYLRQKSLHSTPRLIGPLSWLVLT